MYVYAPLIKPSPMLNQVTKLCQALCQRIIIRPAKLWIQDQVSVSKDLCVEQAWFGAAKEPLVVGEEG
ncbi:uncharacterized protein TrAFT101_005998 [Trichoderma asperellum]|uniref:uncharacterized protein n=1 Tax=Trichoderma asperellum TaxID=101201 RepID=UPI0033219DED|nr:hypothetical protein TrAFT101_005998 [Trichoderma asperellum]